MRRAVLGAPAQRLPIGLLPRRGAAVAAHLEVVRRPDVQLWTGRRLAVGPGQAEEDALGVLVVDLLQHLAREIDAVDVPEALPVMARGAVEILVLGLQEA